MKYFFVLMALILSAISAKADEVDLNKLFDTTLNFARNFDYETNLGVWIKSSNYNLSAEVHKIDPNAEVNVISDIDEETIKNVFVLKTFGKTYNITVISDTTGIVSVKVRNVE